MNCPNCGCTESSVVDSRSSDERVRRRRKCAACSFRFTTAEVYLYTLDAADTLLQIAQQIKATAKRLPRKRGPKPHKPKSFWCSVCEAPYFAGCDALSLPGPVQGGDHG